MPFAPLLELVVATACALVLGTAWFGGRARKAGWWAAVASLAAGEALVRTVAHQSAGLWTLRVAGVVVASALAWSVVSATMNTLQTRRRRRERVVRAVLTAATCTIAAACVPIEIAGTWVAPVTLLLLAGGTSAWCAKAFRERQSLTAGHQVLALGFTVLAFGQLAGGLQTVLAPSSQEWLGAFITATAWTSIAVGAFAAATADERAPDTVPLPAMAEAEAALARSHVERAAIMDVSGDAVHIVDDRLRLVAYNDTFRSRMIRSAGHEPLVGHTVEQFHASRDLPAWEARYSSVLTGRSLQLDATTPLPDGESLIEAVTMSPVRHGDRVIGVAVSSRDASELRRLAEQLHARDEEFRALSEHATDVVFRVDPDGAILFITPSVERLLGWKSEDLIGRSVLMFCASDDTESVRRVFHDAQCGPSVPRPMLFRFRHRAGGLRLLDGVATLAMGTNGEPTLILNARDVTERHALEAELRQRQRGASLGRLVSGVAHDFNNVLTAIFGMVSLARVRDPQATDLAEIAIVAERGRGLVRKLQSFAGETSGEMTVFVPGERVSEVDVMLQRFLGDDVRIRTSLDDLDWTVRMDAGQFEQLLVNLAVAERAATGAGGTISIETSTLHVAIPMRGDGPPVPPGDYVTLRVTGSGSRSLPDAAARAAAADSRSNVEVTRAIVSRAQGVLWSAPAAGNARSYSVFLPRHHEAPSTVHPSASLANAPGGTETIIIAEDDPSIRTAAARMLMAKGYTVLAASNGEDALQQARAFVGTIHLLVTDLVMPQTNGAQLARRLRARRPDMRVILMSGYTSAMAHQAEIADLAAGFLAKPFTPEELLGSVRAALDVTPGGETTPLSRSGHA
ncbi:MAG: PAS domain S-box protein [Gemmatimonadetes bacterium]|nr:PAS domain S-box protein [Gemmatimonadota bacterium]